MVSDATTFFLAFTAVFGGLAWYLWHLDRHVKALEDRLAALEAEEATSGAPAPHAARGKRDHGGGGAA